MENAVKALLIAAGVLIGIMIISLGVSLYTSLSKYVESTQDEIAIKGTQQFNEQFTRFINYDDYTKTTQFTLTIQDIVTAANTAYENNLKTDYYVTINMSGITNLENKINSKSAELLSSELGKQYRCGYADVKINTTTNRVYEVNFHEYTVP
ncbi:MAG: hypothetical protein IJE68_01755 [Clostridia bacterium]|nr:hypothetical protein [Clostridia bacterium]